MKRTLTALLAAAATILPTQAKTPEIKETDYNLRTAISASANIDQSQLPALEEQILENHSQYDASKQYKATITDGYRISKFADPARISKIEILSDDATLDSADTWFAYDLNGSFTNVNGRVLKNDKLDITLNNNPGYNFYKNADFENNMTMAETPEGAGEGLWSDTCWYYNPKDPIDSTIFHPDVWNGKDLNGNIETANRMYVEWFDLAKTKITFWIPAYGVNRALGYGYTRGYLKTLQGGADGVCALYKTNIGSGTLLENSDLVVYVNSSDSRIQSQKVDIVMTPQ